MRNSRSRSVNISDCFDSDKQNIIHLVRYLYDYMQVMKKYLKLRKHTCTCKSIDRFFSSP